MSKVLMVSDGEWITADGRVQFTKRNRDLIANGMSPIPSGRWHRRRPGIETSMACGWQPRTSMLYRAVWKDVERPPERACSRCWP